MSEFVNEDVYSVTSWGILSSWFIGLFYPFILVFTEHLLCPRQCSWCWGYNGEQKWMGFCPLGIHRPDGNTDLLFKLIRDEAVYLLLFHNFIILGSDTYLASLQTKCFSSLTYVFKWPSLFPWPKLHSFGLWEAPPCTLGPPVPPGPQCQ